jgi:Ala-tRNA(Pro) deacylase
VADPASREELFELFAQLGIRHMTVHHRPVFTVEDGADIKASLPGGHTKNLFLKDRNGRYFLLCALGETKIRLNQLHKPLQSGRLSFGSEADLFSCLGVRPGSVSLFCLINDRSQEITLVLDRALLESDPVNFHPLGNDATTAISQANMRRFVQHWGGRVWSADFAGEDIEAEPLVWN